jgi:peptidoglycan glycosyltransferase
MRNGLRAAAALSATALIIYGLFQPVERDGRWLICIWVAAVLLGVALWLSLPAAPRALSRNVQHLGLAFALGFVLLSLQLLRQQVVRADETYNRTVTDPDPDSGQITSNVRPVLASQRTRRGRMYDAQGTLLVSSTVTAGNFARRDYPLAEQFDPAAFSNVLGFFSTRFGYSGLESTYDSYLSGERGSTLMRMQSELLGQPQVGNDLHLTINARLQQRAYELLGARAGSVVVLDPATGAVRAMASAPGFDPRGLSFDPGAEDWDAENARISQYWEQINRDDAGQPLLNRPAQGRYPPGSSFKTVTAIGVLTYPDVGRPDEINCPDQFQPDPQTPAVVNAVRQGLEGLIRQQGEPRLESVYAYSCNTAFAQYALRLGPERFIQVAGQFDFFRPQDAPEQYEGFTDLDTVPSRLFVNPGFLNSPAALADTGYGQGELFVTPLQMAMVAAAIANDGDMMQPYIVDHITQHDGSLITTRQPRRIRRALDPQIAATMRRNMRAAVAYGFGAAADAVPGIAVGGKSGTAQYGQEGSTHAWFIAIAPVEQPRYAVAVMVEGGGEGSSVGAELAGQVLAAAFAFEQ